MSWTTSRLSLIARFLGPTWGPSGTDRTQVSPMLAPWTLLSKIVCIHRYIHAKQWDVITHQYKKLRFNQTTVKVMYGRLITCRIPYHTRRIITYSCRNITKSMLVKWSLMYLSVLNDWWLHLGNILAMFRHDHSYEQIIITTIKYLVICAADMICRALKIAVGPQFRNTSSTNPSVGDSCGSGVE